MINTDWLSGISVGLQIGPYTDRSLVGRVYTQPWMLMLLAYGGLLLDLFIFHLLLWRRTLMPVAWVHQLPPPVEP